MAKKSVSKAVGQVIPANVVMEVGINEVVNVFVSQYEENLHASLKQSEAALSKAEKDITEHDSSVLANVDIDQFIRESKELSVKSTVDRKNDVDLVWDNTKSHITVDVTVTSTVKCSNYGARFDSLDQCRVLPISKKDITRHYALESEIEKLSTEVCNTLKDIRDVSRKERQIRGRISAMKLKESGYDSLLQDKSLLKLVQL